MAVPPTGSVTVSLILPTPDAPHDAPLDATQLHVAPLSALGNVSVTVTPDAADGPAFEATIVYVTDVPATSVADPSVFVTETSAVGVTASTSVAVLFPGVGSVVPEGTATVTAFDSVPVAPAETFAVRVYVTVPPTVSVTVSLMLPVPATAQLAPLDATHDQVAPLSALGSVSVTVTPEAFDGPLFVATIE